MSTTTKNLTELTVGDVIVDVQGAHNVITAIEHALIPGSAGVWTVTTDREPGGREIEPVGAPETILFHVLSATRPLHVIARDIRATWPKPYFGAVPYLQAMGSLNAITDDYSTDSAKSVVLYFLSNATTWRGADARRIKAELKGMAK